MKQTQFHQQGTSTSHQLIFGTDLLYLREVYLTVHILLDWSV